MTKKALAKIPNECKNRIENLSEMVKEMKKQGNLPVCTEYSKKLRGYLECLEDMKVITQNDVRCLYLYYVSV